MAFLLVQTNSGAERTAEAALIAPYRGCSVYFPKILIRRSHAGKVDMVERPFIPRYGFVDDDKGYQVIKNAPGIFNVLGHASRSVNSAVEEIKAREVDGFVILDDVNTGDFKSGEPVQVLSGAFFGRKGLFIMQSGLNRSRILLESLGSVELETAKLERV